MEDYSQLTRMYLDTINNVKSDEQQAQEQAAQQQEVPMLHEVDIPTFDSPAMQMQQTEFDVEVPSQFVSSDPRITGNDEEDMKNFRDFAENDPIMQQYGPAYDELLDELIDRLKDPNDPMDEEEAKQLYLEKFEELFKDFTKE